MAVYGNGVAQLAGLASAQTQISPVVEIAQWYTEEGTAALHTSTWSSFGNNPAGIRPGNAAADALSTGTSSGGFDIFPTPQAGAQAYADVLSQQNFATVRKAAQTGQFTMGGHTYTGDAAQMVALGASPWDAAHYTGNTGRVGGQLFGSYSAITGKGLNTQAPSAAARYNPLTTKTVSGFLKSIDSSMQLQSSQGLSVWSFPGYFFGNIRPMGVRLIFFILGLLMILFAALAFVGQNQSSVAKVVAGMGGE